MRTYGELNDEYIAKFTQLQHLEKLPKTSDNKAEMMLLNFEIDLLINQMANR